MRFGYVWKGPGVPTLDRQRSMVGKAERWVEDAKGERSERDLAVSILRDGDELRVATARVLGDDIVDLHHVLAAVAEAGAHVTIAEYRGQFQGSREMATLTEDFQGSRQKDQTQAARERLKKLPPGKRGGRSKKVIPNGREDEFIELWCVKDNSKRFVARQFDTTTKVVDRWAAERGLPEK